MKGLFGIELFERARELNLVSRFTDVQVEKIENTAKQILDVAEDKTKQQRIVANLNLETSLLLCAWLMRECNKHVCKQGKKQKRT